MTVRRPLVAVIDDDASVRESLPDMLRELGYAASEFASAEEFLASDGLSSAQCLLLDIAMPGMSGPELHRELLLKGCGIPVIFMTALKGLPPRLSAHHATACLRKPFSEQDLDEALATALPDR
jgi:FixJ family two-component response regulator